MKSHVDLLNDTIKYYKTNPRSFCKEVEVCQYINKEGSRCAIGRVLPKRVCQDLENIVKQDLITDISGATILGILGHSHVFTKKTQERLNKLTEDYDKLFLNSLQDLHDQSCYWETPIGGELSLIGKTLQKELLTKAQELDEGESK